MIRRACVLAGLLALFLQGSSGGHMLLVEHTRCAEHGELVHNADPHRHVAAEHSHGAVSVHGAPDEGTGQTHDHCALSVNRRDSLVSVGTPLVTPRAFEAPDSVAIADVRVVTHCARFRIAPKNSPPA